MSFFLMHVLPGIAIVMCLGLARMAVQRWQARSFPELELVEDLMLRATILELVRRRGSYAAWCTAGSLSAYIVAALVGLLSLWVLPTWSSANAYMVLALMLVAIVLHHCLIGFLTRRCLGHALRRELIDRGIPVCMHCGYCLRGLEAIGTCPECGRSIA